MHDHDLTCYTDLSSGNVFLWVIRVPLVLCSPQILGFDGDRYHGANSTFIHMKILFEPSILLGIHVRY
jgi:hypothetical protein